MENKKDFLDIFFMRQALKEAEQAFAEDEVPVGAVIVLENKIIAKAHNQVETLKDPTAHAEILAITQAANHLSSKWLYDCSVYVTIEPCSMCAGALVLSRIKDICFGAKDLKAGACGSVMNIARHKSLNHRIEIKKSVLEKDCGFLMTEFFKKKRKQKK